jgi:hypothetical protein
MFSAINYSDSAWGAATDAENLLYIANAEGGSVQTVAYPYTGTSQVLSSNFTNPWSVGVWP